MLRLQGTDGVRKIAVLSSHPAVAGLSPQQAFLAEGVITEQFMELYLFCRARQLLSTGAAERGEPFVIGWDPRDPNGSFTRAAAAGIAKGGLCPWTIGVAPTPMCAFYAQWAAAAGAAVVTASHNPQAYNGIKIFTRHGLKLLPADDVALTENVLSLDYAEEVASARLLAPITDKSAEAREAFIAHAANPANSWLEEPETVKNIRLALDLSNGAMAPFAEEILRRAGFCDVDAFYTALDGDVNAGCGVTQLEGLRRITPEMTAPGGRLGSNLAIARMFQRGRAERDAITQGACRSWAAVFDGDGDRLYLAVYDPLTDSATVLDGDGAATLLAWRMAGGGGTFVNTVESDLNASVAAEDMGYRTKLAAVGDKWILSEAMLELIRIASPQAMASLEKPAAEGSLGADMVEQTLDEYAVDFSGIKPPVFIGAEESGHAVTTGFMTGPDGRTAPVHHGSGIQLLLNTAAAIMEGGMDAHGGYLPGFKKTMYIYHVDKGKWRRGSSAWVRSQETAAEWAKTLLRPLELEEMIRLEEADMLYLKLMDGQNHVASVFIRSSGTEDKTGVSLRGPEAMSSSLQNLGETLARQLSLAIKDTNSAMGRAELRILAQAAEGGVLADPVEGFSPREYQRLLEEAAKQGLIDSPWPGAGLTERGAWLLPRIKVGR